MHMIKIGSQYLTPDGTFSPFQRHALRVSDVSLVRDNANGADVRTVKIKPRQTSAGQDANASNGQDSGDGL
jgi:hypothetical protein